MKFLMLFLVGVLLVNTGMAVDSASDSSAQFNRFSRNTIGLYDQSIQERDVVAFLEAMKKALQNDDIKTFSKLISYPCRWNNPSNSMILENMADFLKYQTEILTPTIKRLILNPAVDDLLVTKQGFVISNGEIWFDPHAGILAFNQMD